MTNDPRHDLAAIRAAIDDGRRFAAGSGGFMAIWGGAIALADFATYVAVRGWLDVDPNIIWTAAVPLAWVATLLLAWREQRVRAVSSRAGRTLAMTWLACGIALSVLYACTRMTGHFEPAWFLAAVAGVMGIGFFVSAELCAYRWMRAVAAAWWLGEVALFIWGTDAWILVLSGAMMLLMLALPGVVLLRETTPSAA